MNRAGERLLNGLVKENPTLVLMLGMCPTLAVTTSAVNGFGMGATTLMVLAMSNLIISLLRNIIPRRVRIPAFIVIIASFVTVVELLMQAYLPSLNRALGVYIPLIVVNCIILGRAESYAYSNPPVPALFDGIGMGLGFTAALTVIGAVRELLGAGELFGFRVLPDSYEPMLIFVLAPGAFFVLAALTALQNYVREKLKKAGRPYEKIGSGCAEDCLNCADTGCSRRFYDMSGDDLKAEELEYQDLGQEAEPDLECEDLEYGEPWPAASEEAVPETAGPEPEEVQSEYEEPEGGASEEAVSEEPEGGASEEAVSEEPEGGASEEAVSKESAVGSEAAGPESEGGESEHEEPVAAVSEEAGEAEEEKPETDASEGTEEEESGTDTSEEAGEEEPKREQKEAAGQNPSGSSRNQGAGNQKKSGKKKKKRGKKGGR